MHIEFFMMLNAPCDAPGNMTNPSEMTPLSGPLPPSRAALPRRPAERTGPGSCDDSEACTARAGAAPIPSAPPAPRPWPFRPRPDAGGRSTSIEPAVRGRDRGAAVRRFGRFPGSGLEPSLERRPLCRPAGSARRRGSGQRCLSPGRRRACRLSNGRDVVPPDRPIRSVHLGKGRRTAIRSSNPCVGTGPVRISVLPGVDQLSRPVTKCLTARRVNKSAQTL